ncbi:carbohydrate binding domain-containing protein [Patescibacteria group bacterium]
MGEKFVFWKSMDGTQKLTFSVFVVILVSFPIMLFALLNPKIPLFSEASTPVTSTTMPEIDHCKEISGNLVKNFNFEKGKRNWRFYKSQDGRFQAIKDGHSCKRAGYVQIKRNSKTLLYQNNIRLQPNTTYEISFDAKTTRPQSVGVSVRKTNKPHTNYGLEYGVSLTTEWQKFSTTFVTPATVDRNSRLRFLFAGMKNDEFWIDDVILTKYIEPTVTPTPNVTNTPTPTFGPTITLTPTPSISNKRVFITSTEYDGNLGGLRGADAKCQERADAAILGGVWHAWLSDSTNEAKLRSYHYPNPIYRIDGVKVADHWGDLTDGSLDEPIVVDEWGRLYSESSNILKGVWTNTASDGSEFEPPEGWNLSSSSCNNWSTNETNVGVRGVYGYPFSTLTNGWTSSTYTSCAINNRHLYCFEQ